MTTPSLQRSIDLYRLPPVGIAPPPTLVGANGGSVDPTIHAMPPNLDWHPSPPTWVGGTSGGGDNSGGNVLNVNLGGASLNYDIGPNTEHFTNSAYQFLDNSFSRDQEFLGHTIIGGQRFLAGYAEPLAAFNLNQLPKMFGDLNAQNFILGQEAIQTEGVVAQSSIEASRASAASAGGGGCYVTAACCAQRESDDGPTLATLRHFRDSYMLATPKRRQLVALYYQHAPALVQKIQARADSREFLERLFVHYIMPARLAIERGENERAFFIYCKALYDIQRALIAPTRSV